MLQTIQSIAILLISWKVAIPSCRDALQPMFRLYLTVIYSGVENEVKQRNLPFIPKGFGFLFIYLFIWNYTFETVAHDVCKYRCIHQNNF